MMAACLYLLTGCDKNDADPNIPVMDMSTDYVLNKSDREVEVTLEMTVPGGIKSLEISKGVNLQPDAAYGVKTVNPAPAGDNKFKYVFYYTLQRGEIDKLVGFNFKLTDNAGRVVEKDLTVHTEANAAEIIYSRKWKLLLFCAASTKAHISSVSAARTGAVPVSKKEMILLSKRS